MRTQHSDRETLTDCTLCVRSGPIFFPTWITGKAAVLHGCHNACGPLCSFPFYPLRQGYVSAFLCFKVKVKVHTLDIAPLRSESPPQKRSGMTRSQGMSQFYLHTYTLIRNRNEPYLPLPAGTHLPTLEGWKAELTLVRSSAGRDSNPQPPACKSGTLPHGRWCLIVIRKVVVEL